MMFTHVPLRQMFTIQSGHYHAKHEVRPGKIPLISCGDTNNGLIGHYDIPDGKTFSRCITVAYNGSPLLAKYHPYRFGAKDDVGVLRPRFRMRESTLLFIAAMLNLQRWRYSYGRKCFKQKLPDVAVPMPATADGDIDQEVIAAKYVPHQLSKYVPDRFPGEIRVPDNITWRRFAIKDLWHIDTGDFNSYGEFPEGTDMVISRSAQNNGLAGYFRPPSHARLFPPGTITVSTVSGDAFVQLHPFYASDKVVLLTPRRQMQPHTLFFAAFSINRNKWRYSYGRSCFPRTMRQATLLMPVDAHSGELAQATMEYIVGRAPYWGTIERFFSGGPRTQERVPVARASS